jgi:hypothetical protein
MSAVTQSDKATALAATVASINAACSGQRVYSPMELMLYNNAGERISKAFTAQLLALQTSIFPPLPLWISAKRRAIRAIKTERWIPCPNTRWAILRDALQFNITRHV